MAMPMCPQYQSDHGLCRKFCLVSGLWRFLRFCRKVRFLGQNPKIECREFNDLQTAKLSKKQLCDRTDERANWLRSLAVAGAGRAILDSRMVKKLMRPRAHSISGAPQAVRDTAWGL